MSPRDDRSRTEALREADREARLFAQREFVRPVVLEAGAGTGKTATLVARIVTWCIGPGWERARAALPEATLDGVAARVLEGVVAITFTEAAASEMAERVEGALSEVAAGRVPRTISELDAVPDPERAERANLLGNAIDRLVVQTIHAWCRSLLFAHPIEARLHPNFEVDPDGSVRKLLMREVLDEALREAYGDPGDPETLELAARGVGPGELEEILLALVDSGVSAGALDDDPLSEARIAEAVEALHGGVTGLLRAAGGAFESCTRSKVSVATAEALVATLEGLDPLPIGVAGLTSLCEGLRDGWDDKELYRLKEWSKLNLNKTESEALGARADGVAAAASELYPILHALHRLEPLQLVALHGVLRGLLHAFERRARARGVIGFQGLLESCANLLDQHPGVAARLREGLDQLLVDEFQDTDARQCSIVEALALRGPDRARPGLFLVGDPKQSIYGWRSADLAAYEGFLAAVVEAGGELCRLSVNYRSVPPILDEVDRLMPTIMEARAGLQPSFEPLVASPQNEGSSGFHAGETAPVEHWLPVKRDADGLQQTSMGEATRLEARALASDLRRLHDAHDVAWGGIGVLFRSRGDWDVYLSALREAGVPFNVEGDRSYYQRREIIEAAALVRCLLDPEDRLALATALRSTAVGVPDAALAPLFKGRVGEHVAALPNTEARASLHDLVEEVRAGLPAAIPGIERVAGWHHNLEDFFDAVAELRGVLEREAGDVFVEAVRLRTLFEVGEAGRFLGSWRAANLERFFVELASQLSDGVPRAEVLRSLRHAVAEEEPREEGRPRDLLPDAVRILTLHGAKGLDFDHVYLMQLQKGRGGVREGVSAQRVDGRLELSLAGVETLGFCHARARQAAVESHERVRLLYVGMTRARERLVMSWLPQAFRRGGKDSLAHLVEQREPRMPDLATLDAHCAEAKGDRRLEGETLFVLPSRGVAAAAPEPEETEPVVYDVARVEADAAKLTREAVLASQRMERPLAGRASDRPDAAPSQAGGAADGLRPEVARAVGTLVHAALEHFDTAADPARAFEGARATLAADLVEVEGAMREEVRREAQRLFEGLRGGHLLAKLSSLDGAVIARELPLLLPAGPDDEAVAFVSGAIDLLYRDPADGRFVVVDYKSDRLAESSQLAARAAEHAHQGAIYQRAVEEALGLPEAPRFEVWFLAHDRVVGGSDPLDTARPDGAAPEQLGLDFDAS
jgi:ATP-dependent helicase/nuclease subunit A